MNNCRYFFITIVFLCTAWGGDTLRYYNAESFLLEGCSVLANQKEGYYDRLPLKYKEKVRKQVWELSKNSAGMSVRFKTNSTKIAVKWELLNDFHMNHMAGTGIRGLDLYRKENKGWQYVKTAIPQGKTSERILIKNMDSKMAEYKIYLPLYDGLKNLEIGIDTTAKIKGLKKPKKSPIVFYGTSITQGGCASRPGMAYTSIISRKLDRECINLGFSGNGRMEAPIGEFISQIDAEFIVIDCLPNMTAEAVESSVVNLTNIIRTEKNKIPIVFVENIYYTTSWFDNEEQSMLKGKNQALKKEFNKMIDQGIINLYYISADDLISGNYEGTVDGVHLTDLGFMRIADAFIYHFKKFNLAK